MTAIKPEYPESVEDPLPVEETERMISSSKVEGTNVFNGAGDKLGQVRSFMVDKYTGQVHYAVMSFGGFLGIGERYHPLPWKLLRYDEQLSGYVVGLKTEILRAGPTVGSSDDPQLDRQVFEYYGVPFAI